MAVTAQLLGEGRVVLDDGTTRTLTPTMRDQALVYLALSESWVTRDRLGFLFWADAPDASARHNLRQLLKRIRQLDWLDGFETDQVSVRWTVPTDVAGLRDAISSGNWADLPASGDLLPGLERGATLEFEEWLLGERRRVNDEWQTALIAAARSAADAGNPADGARILEPLLDGDEAAGALPLFMELSSRAGHRALALGTFERVAARLRADLGVDPPARAVDMARRLASETPWDAPAAVRDTFVGRKDELAEIAGLLARPQCRLLTLLGPGGIGKSAMATMLLDRTAGGYRDGGMYASLEATTEPADIPVAIAAELDITLDGRLDPLDEVTAALRRRDALLVVDNVEHLADGWNTFSRILESCPTLRIVVTSRERLRLEGEWVYEVGGLGDEEAIELFLRKACHLVPDLEVSREAARSVCHSVGGSPLGIELAVPWLRVMPVDEIVVEIERNQEILSGGSRDGLTRHHSVSAAMEHSWVLATPQERDVAEALSVFAGPYSREMGESVAGAKALVLRDLIDKSLVQRRGDNLFFSHPLVRRYAAARLELDGERAAAVRGRHAAAVLSLQDPPARRGEFPASTNDVVVAWTYAVEHGSIDLLARSAEDFTSVMHASGRISQGLELLGLAAARVEGRSDGVSGFEASMRLGQSRLLSLLGRHHEAAANAHAALEGATEAGDDRMTVLAGLSLGWAQKRTEGDATQYRTIATTLPIARSLGDDVLIAEVLNGLGCSAESLEQCRDHLVEGLGVATTADPGVRARLLQNLGMVAWALGDGAAGRGHVQEALGLARAEELTYWVVSTLCALAFIETELGDVAAARELVSEAADLTGASEVVELRIYVNLIAGEVWRQLGDAEGARVRMYDALRMSVAVGNDPYALRALRLHAQLLVGEGEVDRALRVQAFVVSQTSVQGGDFTNEIINPRTWTEMSRSIDGRRIEAAHAWARERDLNDVVGEVLAGDSEGLAPG